MSRGTTPDKDGIRVAQVLSNTVIVHPLPLQRRSCVLSLHDFFVIQGQAARLAKLQPQGVAQGASAACDG
eukprot:43121-Eustigmatos_ZCMA.PRE.1